MPDKKVYINGNIYTQNSSAPRAEAILIENGVIIEIGVNRDLRPYSNRGYELIDLKGNTVVPGIIDAHLHMLSLGRSFRRVNLDGVASLDEVKRIVKDAVTKLEPGRWLFGRGWNKNLWGNDFPSKEILDEVCPVPAVLGSKDGHLLWVNSACLKQFGITRETPDPPGGVILKDSLGEPTGILKENAVELVYDNLPPEPYDEKINAIKAAHDHLLSLGITGFGDCDEDDDLFPIYRELDESGQLKLRTFKIIPRNFIKRAISLKYATGVGSEHFRIGALKLYADGALGSQTAYMFEPYSGSDDNYGVETLPPGQLDDLIGTAANNKISVAIHAIGDKANYQTLTGIANHREKFRQYGLRPRIEHCQILRESDIDLFRRHEIIASVQPIHATSDRDVADKYWGARARFAYPFKSLLDKGVCLAFGSDAPIEIANPLAGIHAAVTRQRKGETRPAWYPEERISVAQALDAYTTGAAYACCYDDIVGILKPGYTADFVVLSENIFEIAPERIADVVPLMTVIDGQIAYKK